jgi:ketosteroid isomerase-like protein
MASARILAERKAPVPVDEKERQVVEDLYRAMQIGPAAEETIMALFAEDAVLVEPFTGKPQAHAGKPAIRASLAAMWQKRAPDLVLNLDRVDLDGETVRAEWTCTSAVLPGPMRGCDLLTVRSGKVTRMEIVITEMPQFGPT